MLAYGHPFRSALLLGTAQYPSPAILAQAVAAAQPGAITVSVRREGAGGGGQAFWDLIVGLGVPVLPNTAGCHSVEEAVTTAQMARELFATNWIKLEVIGDADLLQPDPFGLVDAARILTADGFDVFPYCTEDLVVADRLLQAGCQVLMPWGAPIGTGKGLNNITGLRALRARYPAVPMVIDAGLGVPSHAAQAMELGFDAVLVNTAVAKAGDPVGMANAFALAVQAGRAAYQADPMEPRDMAVPSTPLMGLPFTPPTRPAPPALPPVYLIIDDVDWLPRLLPTGIQLIQLRLKDKSDRELRRQITRAKGLCQQAGVQLVVNDYWQLAIELCCDYVHLGQEDLAKADLATIRAAGLKLGISTHDEDELATALAAKPNYIALGPIYPTVLKAMRWAPQGLARLADWKRRIGGDIPLVAIGGLTPERALGAFRAGADSCAVVTDVLRAPSPETRLQEWLAI